MEMDKVPAWIIHAIAKSLIINLYHLNYNSITYNFNKKDGYRQRNMRQFLHSA